MASPYALTGDRGVIASYNDLHDALQAYIESDRDDVHLEDRVKSFTFGPAKRLPRPDRSRRAKNLRAYRQGALS